MENSDSYLAILIDSLQKKSKLLDGISAENERQYQAIRGEEINYDLLDETINRKEEYIGELDRLDQGFQKVYDRVKETIQQEKLMHKDQIVLLQSLVREVTDKGLRVEREEKRNHTAFTNAAVLVRKKSRSVQTAQRVATGYYTTMNKLNVVDSQFMDQKK